MSVIFLALTLIAGVFGDGEVVFLSKPPNIEFRGHETVDSDIVKDICSISLGFTTYQTEEWPGMYVTSPFNFAEAVVVLSVPGVSSLKISNAGHVFPFYPDLMIDEIVATLESKTNERYSNRANQTLVEINLEEGVNSAELILNNGKLELERYPTKYLNDEEAEDITFLDEIYLLKAILNNLQKNGVSLNGLPDLYWFDLKGLHPIIDLYGDSSNTATEATELVVSTAQQMKAVFDEAYQNRTLFMVVTSDSMHTRRFRRETGDEIMADRNLAPVYDENYPVFFNIFFWFTIAFIMTIIATSMVTACMDPGRDSIIYRMTSTRMKKDN